jgi:hypothetical protein
MDARSVVLTVGLKVAWMVVSPVAGLVEQMVGKTVEWKAETRGKMKAGLKDALMAG